MPIPDPREREAFAQWLAANEHSWSVVIAARSALRILPLIGKSKISAHQAERSILPAFRAVAISRFAAIFPKREVSAIAALAAVPSNMNYPSNVANTAYASADIAAGGNSHVAAITFAIANQSHTFAAAGAINDDAQTLASARWSPHELAYAPLWGGRLPPAQVGGAWQGLSTELFRLGPHWRIWTDWYDNILHGTPPVSQRVEAWEAAFTDVDAPLPWEQGAEAVNEEIASRLRGLVRPKSADSKPARRAAGAAEPTASTRKSRLPKSVPRTEIGKAIASNNHHILLNIEPLFALIEKRIAELHDERPNSQEARSIRDNEITELEDIKKQLVALRAVSRDFPLGRREEEAAVGTAVTFTKGVMNWWSKSHVKICDNVTAAGLFVGCVGICSLVGSGGPITVALSAALVGGKPILEALKSLPKKVSKLVS